MNTPDIAPLFLGKYNYETNKKVEQIIPWVDSFCDQTKIDFTFNNKKFIWTCVYYLNEEETHVKIQLYKKNEGYILDICRYRGDGFAFVDVIRASNCYFNEKPLPEKIKIQKYDLVDTYDTETTNALISMIKSDFSDIQAQGSTVLANMSLNASVLEIIFQDLHLFIDKLDSPIPTVYRCATTILANILEKHKVKQQEEIRQKIEILKTKTLIKRVLRECERCLSVITKNDF